MKAAVGGAAAAVLVTVVMLVLLCILSCFLKDGPWREGDYVPSSQWYVDTNPFVLISVFICLLVLIPGAIAIRLLSLEPTIILVLAVGLTCNALIGALVGLAVRFIHLTEQEVKSRLSRSSSESPSARVCPKASREAKPIQ